MAALQDQFNPFGSGNGWDVGAIAIMLAWGVVAGVIATITFRWSAPESRRASTGRMTKRPGAGTAVLPMQLKAEQISTPGQWPRVVQLSGQIHHVLTSVVRNPGWVFFAVAMPVGSFVFLTWSIAPGQPPIAGVPFGISLAAGMITWGTAVTAFVNTPEAVARQRDLGYLKRLQGTPLRPMNYLLGRAVGAAPIAIVMAAAITEIGRIAFGLQVAWWGIPLATVVLGVRHPHDRGVRVRAGRNRCFQHGGDRCRTRHPAARRVLLRGLHDRADPELDECHRFDAADEADRGLPGGGPESGRPTVNWIDLAVLCVWLAIAGALCLHVFSWPRAVGTQAER